MTQSLKTLMLKDHKRINHLLEDFENFPKDNPERSMVFSNFKWNFEKHIFVEDKAVFSILQEISGSDVDDIFKLTEEHTRIIEMIKLIENEIKLNKEVNVAPLGQALKNHADFENEFFYPKLDEFLNQSQKEEVIRRIRSIVVY